MSGEKQAKKISPLFLLGGAVILTALTALLCVCAGSVAIPVGETLRLVARAVGGGAADGKWASIILKVRLPRVLTALLCGAALSVSGGAMQGLLRNPLADGSTLGVSSGAALGAAAAILLGIRFPGLAFSGTTVCAILAAFFSLVLILLLAWRMDRSLSTHTIILIGIIYTMFVSSLMSLLVTFSGEKLRSITFWTMGSFSGAGYDQVKLLLGALLVCGGGLVVTGRALNAFAGGEESAQHLGGNVRAVRLTVMILVSCLVGVCVSVGGSIAFAGLVVPHMVRLFTGPDHTRLLPGCLFGGAAFMMLCDLTARVLLSPIELPVGVVTSMIGAVVFVALFFRMRGRRGA